MTPPTSAAPAVPAAGDRTATPRIPPSRRRVGFVGTGYIADWHARALATLPDVELVAVCDKARSRAQAFADRFGVARVHESLDEMLAAGGLDAVHILLPPDLHAQAARSALEAGVHVLTEKPMCERAEDGEALVRLAEAKGLSLGVGHNYLFSRPYERLRRDVRDGLLGPLDHVVVTWHRELPQASQGPFDAWMLRDPGNVMLEIGSHSAAHLLDLLGRPESLRVRHDLPIELPTGRTFFRRWHVDALKGRVAAELRFSFVPGFTEHAVHVRGLLGSATADLERNTYSLRRHLPRSDDFDRHDMVRDEARGLAAQARQTLRDYIFSKLRPRRAGTPYGSSIARTLEAFYGALGGPLDERLRGGTGTDVIRICGQLAEPARAAHAAAPAAPLARADADLGGARILVLGATGFIGAELLRQLGGGPRVRLLLRSPDKLALSLRTAQIEILRGDLARESDLRDAMKGVECVYHLARANAKTWPEYQRDEIEVTRRIAEAALSAGVKRFIYTGTIDSYYAGVHAGTITEDTPLDPNIERRNLYARAKAQSEALLLQMHRERGLPLVILRPGIVIGRGGSPFHWGVGRWSHGVVCELWGDGRNKLPLVLVEDVARALLLAREAPGLEGQSFNLVADPCLSAREYLDELDRAGGLRLRRYETSIWKYYAVDVFKWIVKILVGHPDRRRPSYRDWKSRTQRATFDCSRAKSKLGWRPVGERAELIRRGIEAPLRDLLR
jgi:predicted dehydrogenase/nucleoside-diphosphate-sugar epimerase